MPISILTDFQREFLKVFFEQKMSDSFYLTGGTALLEIKNLNMFPKMIKNIDLDLLKNYFITMANKLFDAAKPSNIGA
ncbi:hypothetical protein A2526_01045 [candidate division WOR-1 bacterium RIFOXYD2_FULL_36_8]|uniref:Nucleotidyl transferase AbiEii/AbiGii toxin family protein n=1 Tax=candidate division WOR-1 bacterium RIFOXYB2_FULL_36_35 TaxID=1802578 RepID=A0A1F4S2Y7_UNCSA|nr:MAG: hypothetical protein A2230_07665 [candidate division WOR-1 bacterium RIFOXYA2_FULL_36_21]OGC14737.1 MAG: hypothetical protein A2290_08580 [candidate division WOR-1 bacterium RIFOXYB2_FULL_36_35]OGC15479.1 MAG: hypothetical protein A2282_07840 [candidate division WOR-1 bacterium RIFOXYA12_FULL_36_13]OGC38042.1 MAG: hypothetical protein A2526_01045 [candidate division WOR-1 bacterium RIFOXYD2_FULL_36_8]